MSAASTDALTTISAIMDTLKLGERLKFELRHSWLSNGRQESVAEHSYQMALMAMLLHPHLEHAVDLCRVLQMILIHDLVEAEAGDVPYFEKGEAKDRKAERERLAINHLRNTLPLGTGQLVYSLWHEFEAGITREAKFVRSLDCLEVQIQHNLADLATWQPVEYQLVYSKTGMFSSYDSFLERFASAVIDQAEAKMTNAGVDLDAIRGGAGSARELGCHVATPECVSIGHPQMRTWWLGTTYAEASAASADR